MKTTIATGFALALISSAAVAEGLGVTTTLGMERETEAEVNATYASVGLGAFTLGATMKDTAADQAKFNLNKIELDFAQPVGPVTLYIKNDFNDDFKHTETVIGGKVTF